MYVSLVRSSISASIVFFFCASALTSCALGVWDAASFLFENIYVNRRWPSSSNKRVFVEEPIVLSIPEMKRTG